MMDSITFPSTDGEEVVWDPFCCHDIREEVLLHPKDGAGVLMAKAFPDQPQGELLKELSVPSVSETDD